MPLQGNMYLPLCCKPVTLKMISSKPYLLERAIRQRLTRGGGSNGKLLLFIADGDVMAKVSTPVIGYCNYHPATWTYIGPLTLF